MAWCIPCVWTKVQWHVSIVRVSCSVFFTALKIPWAYLVFHGEESAHSAGDAGSIPGPGRSPGGGNGGDIPCKRSSHERRSLTGSSPWGYLPTEQQQIPCVPSNLSPPPKKANSWRSLIIVTASFGEGNGNTLQCSCLENPRDGGA